MADVAYEGMDLCERCGRLAFWREDVRRWLCLRCYQSREEG